MGNVLLERGRYHITGEPSPFAAFQLWPPAFSGFPAESCQRLHYFVL